MTDRERIEQLEAENTELAKECIRAKARAYAAWEVVKEAQNIMYSYRPKSESRSFERLRLALDKLDATTKEEK